MKSRTVFNTTIITPVIRCCFQLCHKLSGWKVNGTRPDLNHSVYVAAPHTSNWDFPLMLSVCFTIGIQARWIGKHTLFPWPFAGLMFWLGGISVNRSKATNVVEQMQAQYKLRDRLELIITPEGTRSKVKEWKTGFYRIAMAAEVPLVLAAVHAPEKTVFISEPFYPTGDYEKDLIEIKKFYDGKIGARADRT
jgi:1-acyl-sn-glycerol-3-phosphate acyltransferase